jgi:hypothetical protein
MLHRLNAVDFSATAMLGRQTLNLRPTDVPRAADLGNGWKRGDFAENILRRLGASRIESIDASTYEGASIVHDLNQPLPGNLRAQFSVVLDGGTIEHIFDVAQTTRNIRDMLRSGGTFISVNICNGHAGHGLFQFSPEFYYSAFSPANGFSRTSVYLVRTSGAWRLIPPPASIGARSAIPNWRFTIICIADRDGDASGDLTVQQSDYANGHWVGRKALPRRFQGLSLVLGRRAGRFLGETFAFNPETISALPQFSASFSPA